jgi:Xaa-Pro aminopeptidase
MFMKNRKMIKGPKALLAIAKAEALGDACFSHILPFIKPGVSEMELAAEIERFLLAGGAEGLAFPTICVFGEHSAEPHGTPGSRRLEKGDLLTMDFGAVVDGMCGDMTRTVAVDRVSPLQREVYETVLRAQEAALAVLREGVRCDFADKAARDVITDAGFGEYYIHGTGHGVGREVHEAPTLNAKSEEVLMENMPVTVEPGVYIPGKFGVRIEDLAIVTKFGIINLTRSEKQLMIL